MRMHTETTTVTEYMPVEIPAGQGVSASTEMKAVKKIVTVREIEIRELQGIEQGESDGNCKERA